MVAAAAAIPVVSAAEIMAHASSSSTLVALGSQQPLGRASAGATSTSTSGTSSTTSTSTGGSSTTAPATATGGSTAVVSKTYTGTAMQNQFGTVQATLVVTGNKITDVIITAPQDNGRSAYINSQAIPILRSETLQAQSANINMVSGATYTSESYLGSLQAALAAAHL
jgi:uncharacterized protein with FMN-binding domain